MEITGGGKRIYTEEEKKAVVERYKSGSLGQVEFCQKEGLSQSALYSWIRKYGERSKFVELAVRKAVVSRGSIELELPHGIRLKIQS